MRGILHSEDFGWSNCPRFGGGSSGTSTVYQEANNQPWSAQQPYLESLFSSAKNLTQNPSNYPQYYPYPTYAPMNDMQTNAVNDIYGLGTQGGTSSLQASNNALTGQLNAGTSASQGGFNQAENVLGAQAAGFGAGATGQTSGETQNYLNSMIGGSTLNPWSSPGFQSVVGNTLASVLPQTTASFINGGRTDSGLASEAATQGAMNAVGNLAFNQYNTQQNLQQQAVSQGLQQQGIQQSAADQLANNYLNQQGNVIKGAAVSPYVDQQTGADLTNAYNAASQLQSNAQNMITGQENAWNYNQDLPFNMLNEYSNIVGNTGYGSSSTSQTQQPYYSNTLSNLTSAASGLGSLGIAAALLL